MSSLPNFRSSWPWALSAAAFLVVLYLLGPILTPFAIAAALAYLGDPIVDRLQRLRLSRTLSVAVVFAVLALLGLITLLALVPLLQRQFLTLLRNIPDWLLWMQNSGLPKLGLPLPSDLRLDIDGLRQLIGGHWDSASNALKLIWGKASSSSGALFALLANLLLVPVVTFYLLRDWDLLVAWVNAMIPPRWQGLCGQLARESDDVLGAFLRGQMLVMLALALYYVAALSLIGLDLALVVGLIIGLVSFVPYLGSVIGILTAGIAMLVQTQEPMPFVWLAVVFGIGQILEGNVLTPWLVGDRIGLHPVTVIFAVMAGGQLFGFTGVLIALPLAAVLAVLLRHFKQRWLQSEFYRHAQPESTGAEDGSEGPLP